MLSRTMWNPVDSTPLLRPTTHTGNEGSAAPYPRNLPAPSGRPGRTGSPDRRKGGPEKILQSFNTWAFKREQPSEPRLMLQFVAEAAAAGAPLPFVLYWGKGPRCTLDEPEMQCLGYLASLAARVRETHAPGAAMKMIFTDTHATLNGHSA